MLQSLMPNKNEELSKHGRHVLRFASLLGVFVLSGTFSPTACTPLDYDSGDAFLEITPEGEAEAVLTHEPGRSEVRVTPPLNGRFTATFSHLDPQVEVSITIDKNELGEQQDVAFPLHATQAALGVNYLDENFDATPASAQGVLNIERLSLDEQSVSFRGSFQGTLVADDGRKAAVSGFIDAQY